MTTYAAFLRGINVGGHHKVAMADLRAMAEDLGYGDVATYINSGNLVFSSTKQRAVLEKQLSAAIADRFGHQVDVCVRTLAQLKKILADNPYPDGDKSKVTVAFLGGRPPAGVADRLASRAKEHEPFTVAGNQVYVHYGNGLGKSELAEKFSALVGVSATVRNVRTIEKVVQLMG